MKLHIALAASVLAAGVVAAPWASQDSANAGPDRSHGGMWKSLGLTDDQQASLRDLHGKQMEQMRALREKMKAMRLTVKGELAKDDPDKGVLERASDEAAVLAKQFSTQRIEHLLAVKGILTKEQFAKLLERDPGMGGPRGKHHGGSWGGPGHEPSGPAPDAQ